MGVRGLTTFIANNSERYLQDYQLHDTYLVIDGNNLASHLYKWVSKSDSAFGGDYDEYYSVVIKFFETLKKCQVTPIVIFDGGYEQKKIKTVMGRLLTKILAIRSGSSFSSTKFFPLFMKQVFWDVMESLNVTCIQCDFEADNDIAAVAREFKCPVLSYDSDFYIFDVLYIPFATLCLDPVAGMNGYFIKCSLYNVDMFLKDFDGLDKRMLPIIATLLGNDYFESSLVKHFLNHVRMPRNRNMSNSERKIHAILNWLKTETIASATSKILSHVKEKNKDAVQKAINSTILDYTEMSSNVSKLLKAPQDKVVQVAEVKQGMLPLKTMDLFTRCKLPSFFQDILTLNVYFCPIQVEDTSQSSAHMFALPVIKAIAQILHRITGMQCAGPLKLWIRMKTRLTDNVIDLDKDMETVSQEIVNNSKDEQFKFLCEILKITNDEQELVTSLPSNWQLCILCYIFWTKQASTLVTQAHVHSLLLMFIFINKVQTRTGYFKSVGGLLKKKGVLLREQGGDPAVSMEECIALSQTFAPLHQTSEKARSKGYYNVATIHLFATFQSVLYHVMYLNALLNYPLITFKMSEFYSGTLLYNVYMCMRKKADPYQSAVAILKPAPGLCRIYCELCKNLSNVTAVSIQPKGKEKRKKKKSKRGQQEVSEEPQLSSEDCVVADYNDVNNPFFHLQECS